MLKVDNKKTIRKLAYKSLIANKGRNLVVICAIVLTTVLFTSLFTIGAGMKESFERETMRQSGGSAHASMKYLSDEQFNKIKNHPLIKEIGYNRFMGDAQNNEFLKRKTEIWYCDEVGAKLSFNTPTTGRLPQKENEIATDTITMDLLGIPHEVGKHTKIEYTIGEKKYTKDFVISGFWKGEPTFAAGMILVSKQFSDNALKDVLQNFWKDKNMIGTVTAYLMFDNSIGIEDKVKSVITQSGYKPQIDDNLDSKTIAYGANWAYLNSQLYFDFSTLVMGLLVILLIFFTGYLIIYNIFHISVIKDIHFYGLLKTIGTTSRQIKSLIRKQALILSVIGIPLGAIFGFILGNLLVPVIMNISNYSGGYSYASINPLIFIVSALFALITIYISIRKPGSIASKVSPVEAVKYTGINTSDKKKMKKSSDGIKLHRMALSNITRYKKRSVIVILSMSLSLVLLNTTFAISRGFDMDIYLRRYVKTDFIIAHANYFNVSKQFRTESDRLSQSIIDAVSQQKGFEDGGKIYYHLDYVLGKNVISSTVNYKGNSEYLQLYGMEDFPLKQLEIVQGDFDLNKFKSGKYILEALMDDDYGKTEWEKSHFAIGEKVKINVDGKEHEYEIMAKYKYDGCNSVRSYGQFALTLPAGEFAKIEKSPVPMSYQFNVEDSNTEAVDKFVKDYTEKIEPTMNYESKNKYIESFKSVQNMFVLIGGVLSFIIGLIGILNFINSVVTGIITRKHEFAMLQSIGMTDPQLKKLVIYEGTYYAIGTIIMSLALSLLFSVALHQGMSNLIWFFSYKFIISPLLIAYPFLIAFSVVIPIIALSGVHKQSIVERLTLTY